MLGIVSVFRYDVKFIGMVLPGDDLTVKLRHFGMRDGNKDGHVKTLPLFADIDVRCPKYMFSHPGGLLFATQFAQIALVVTEKAAFEDTRVKGFIQKDCIR